MYKPNAVTFKVPNGFDNFSGELKALLFDLKHVNAPYGYNYKDDPTYNNEPILWVDKEDIDSLLQNDEFWGYLIDGSIKSYKNFNIKTKSDITDTPNDGLSNDNTMAIFMSDNSNLLYSGATYLPDSEYQRDFVLTAEYIENKSYIKDWIEERGIEDNFNMTKTVGELKEDLKEYYSLIEGV